MAGNHRHCGRDIYTDLGMPLDEIEKMEETIARRHDVPQEPQVSLFKRFIKNNGTWDALASE